MNWFLAALAPVVVGGAYALTGKPLAATVAYDALSIVAIWRARARIQPLFRWNRDTALWAAGSSVLFVACLALAPLILDLASYRELFRRDVLLNLPSALAFAVFAGYTMVVHVPLEEIFWRGAVLDPERAPLPTAVAGNAVFFYLTHAAPLGLLLGPKGCLFALPTALAGGAWAFLVIRSRSLWPGLASHWAADAAILAGMAWYFVRTVG